MSGRKLMPWLAATLFVAVAVHVASLYAIPAFVMSRVMALMGSPNAAHLGQRPDASFRVVVRPSTDLLYVQCPYDLSDRPLLVTSPVPQGTWWSAAAYDANTNNYFVRDDRQQHGPLRLLIYPPRSNARPKGDAVVSPTGRGIVIFRTLIDSESHLAALDALRRQTSCTIVR